MGYRWGTDGEGRAGGRTRTETRDGNREEVKEKPSSEVVGSDVCGVADPSGAAHLREAREIGAFGESGVTFGRGATGGGRHGPQSNCPPACPAAGT